MDAGLQVTTVSQSFYDKTLSNFEIHLLDELLEVKAANGETVLCTGFIEVDITFHKYCLASEIIVSTYALVVPDTQSKAQPNLLICTNTLDLRVLP